MGSCLVAPTKVNENKVNTEILNNYCIQLNILILIHLKLRIDVTSKSIKNSIAVLIVCMQDEFLETTNTS